jgi:hypothetical protein
VNIPAGFSCLKKSEQLCELLHKLSPFGERRGHSHNKQCGRAGVAKEILHRTLRLRCPVAEDITIAHLFYIILHENFAGAGNSHRENRVEKKKGKKIAE